jgi:hypothetical protein
VGSARFLATQLHDLGYKSAVSRSGQLRAQSRRPYRRCHITVLDRDRLEQRTCECYAVVKKEYDRLLPPSMAI